MIELLFINKTVSEMKQLDVDIERNNTTDDAVNNTYEDIERSLDEDLNF